MFKKAGLKLPERKDVISNTITTICSIAVVSAGIYGLDVLFTFIISRF